MKKRYYNKWLIFLLILAIVLPQGFGRNTHQVLAAQTGTVTATTLNVRTEPSTTASKLQLNGTNVFLKKGETVDIISTKDDFYYVSLKFNGKTLKGYVHKDYVQVAKPSATPTTKPTATPKPTQNPTSSSGTTIKKKVEISATVNASSLNVRSGAGTSYSRVASLKKGDTITVISELNGKDKNQWYGISVKVNGKTVTGYVSSAYVKLSYKKAISGTISYSKLKIRSNAGSKAAYLKNKSGSIITLDKNKSISLTGETTISGVKWYKISFTVSGVKYVGYVEATKVNFKTTVASVTTAPKPTTKPTTTPKPTTKPTSTPKPTVAPTPTTKPTTKPTTTPKPTTKPTTTPKPTGSATLTPSADIPVNGNLIVSNVIKHETITTPVKAYVCNTYMLNVFSSVTPSMEYMLDSQYQPIVVMNSQEVIVTQAVNLYGTLYYKADFWNNGGVKTGYVLADYINIDKSSLEPSVTPSPTTTPTTSPTDNLSYREKLRKEGFPESYLDALVKLHELHPTWEFKAYHTGLDWSTVIKNESIPGKNLIPNSRGVEWLSFDDGAYNWKKDTFTIYDGTYWVTASKVAIEYYMDPRNFLTENGIFQFEQLKYQKEYQNASGVENILKGTALYNKSYSYVDESGATKNYTYGQTFINAAEYSGVSPYHLASRVKQEVVTGSTTLSASVSGTYKGYEGLYNFYNIGANDSAGGGAIANGLKYARDGSSNQATNALYMIPWTNPFKSIVGGSYFIGGSYINRGQDTIYLQKFNVTPTSTYYHQYMSNVEAPFAEGKKVYTAYSNMADSPIVFSIPVYLNMPSKAASYPAKMYNPNNRMASLNIKDSLGNELKFTPTFSQTEYNYYLIVDNTIDKVQISATTVSKKAKIASGTGTISLNVGNNEVIIPVIAENGDVANYKVTIVRSQ